MLQEFLGKRLLEIYGMAVPPGRVATTPIGVAEACDALGLPAMVKAQVAAGGRGKAGGVRRVESSAEAELAASGLLGSVVGGFTVDRVLVEKFVEHENEYYLAVTDDALYRAPVVLCSACGGLGVEEVERQRPGSVQRMVIGMRRGISVAEARILVERAAVPRHHADAVVSAIGQLWECYRATEAELVEVNPLVVERNGKSWGLDAKVALDETAIGRHEELEQLLSGEAKGTGGSELERVARSKGLLFIELAGDVGIVANGAGLAMATLDVVTWYGGQPANFLEVGGDNYTKATAGVEIVLSNPRVRSLLVNFCGAFARTDVMAEGVIQALEARSSTVPVFFSIHGTGYQEAVELVKSRLGITPYAAMDDAVRAAVRAAAGSGA